MASSWKHADRFADDALDELAAAGWPSRSREAVAEWFALSPSDRAEAQEALNVVVPRQGQRPPFPVDLLYVPSSGGSLPTAGPTSAQIWLASLQPKPGEPLMVFPATGARYERESISSMRGVGGFETEAVIGSAATPTPPNIEPEPPPISRSCMSNICVSPGRSVKPRKSALVVDVPMRLLNLATNGFHQPTERFDRTENGGGGRESNPPDGDHPSQPL